MKSCNSVLAGRSRASTRANILANVFFFAIFVGCLNRDEVLLSALCDFYAWIPRQGRISVSIRVARNHRKGPYFARQLRMQARHFERTQSLLPSMRGKKTKAVALIDDEFFRLGLQRWLRTLEVGKVSPKLMHTYVNTVLLPSVQSRTKKRNVSLSQARRWLHLLGYRRSKHKKAIYWDGHERPDVQKRRKQFLKEMAEFDLRLAKFDDNENGEFVRVAPSLQEGEKEIIVIFHDESTVHANDYELDYWVTKGQQVLKKKTRGRLIMISEFICEDTGLIRLTPELLAAQEDLPLSERLPEYARKVIMPGNKESDDDYWNMDQMIDQMKTVLRMFDKLHPNKQAVFIFDNSSAHNSLAKDALTVTKMNIGPGGKVPPMRNTVIPKDNPHGFANQTQSLLLPSSLPRNHPDKAFEGQPKGIRNILQERGLIKRLDGTKISGTCADCRGKKKRKGMDEAIEAVDDGEDEGEEDDDDEGYDSEEDGRRRDCCMRRLLSQEDDFKNEKSLLEKEITAAGHHCLFLPKFHPELNPIEMYWGWVKRYFRQRRANGNFQRAKKLILEALDACPVDTIRKFFRRAYRYMSTYRLGATGLLAEYAVKTYRSHRAISQKDLVEAEASMKVKKVVGRPEGVKDQCPRLR
ncbi:hypothetical protein SISNIDRAFT_442933 [Sistotremastrum niveocremeum HHB9708]|uniref:Tc1-like transposase DDE domain-containing protein n=1 Tax=Sistotremastrum niveocremeum HHB9708 TaxID=1314777 RepID=A0A164T4F2_9AGAM|nr:hypothetical protein SISNIDRAFT_442933 [Sistotremastrum niveocremeum HHB9708]